MEQGWSNKTYVLDSWPVLEWLQEKEPTARLFDEFVHASLRDGKQLVMSRINYGEVLYNCRKSFRSRYAAMLADIESLPIDILSVDDSLVDEAAALKAVYPIAYADCFAAALALRLKAPLVSGDGDFRLIEALQLYWAGA